MPAPPAARSSPAKRPGTIAIASGYCWRKDRAAPRSRPLEADLTKRQGGIYYQFTGIAQGFGKKKEAFKKRISRAVTMRSCPSFIQITNPRYDSGRSHPFSPNKKRPLSPSKSPAPKALETVYHAGPQSITPSNSA